MLVTMLTPPIIPKGYWARVVYGLLSGIIGLLPSFTGVPHSCFF